VVKPSKRRGLPSRPLPRQRETQGYDCRDVMPATENDLPRKLPKRCAALRRQPINRDFLRHQAKQAAGAGERAYPHETANLRRSPVKDTMGRAIPLPANCGFPLSMPCRYFEGFVYCSHFLSMAHRYRLYGYGRLCGRYSRYPSGSQGAAPSIPAAWKEFLIEKRYQDKPFNMRVTGVESEWQTIRLDMGHAKRNVP
jgi:hypothetical protein